MTTTDIAITLSPFAVFFLIVAIGFGFAHYFDVKGQ
jgi:hypothetical protein